MELSATNSSDCRGQINALAINYMQPISDID